MVADWYEKLSSEEDALGLEGDEDVRALDHELRLEPIDIVLADDIGARDRQEIIVPLDVTLPVREALTAIIVFAQPEAG